MEAISFQYPSWFIIFCFLAGLGFAALLYYRDKTFAEKPASLRFLMAALRFLSVFFISLLLLQPLVKSILSETKKPVVIIGQDVSESIASSMSAEKLAEYNARLAALSGELGDKFEVKTYGFGSGVKEERDFKYEDKSTNIAQFLKTIYDNYSNQNLGAILLASDGIYNEGSNPLYTSSKLNVPIYTVALGDTTQKKDLLIKRVFNNKIVYLGDKFSILADVAGLNLAGNATTLTVQKVDGGNFKNLQQFPISIDKNDFFATREIILEADQPGVQRYRLLLNGLPGEATTGNNSKDIFIDVLDARQKILLLANSPHPDISALKQTLETSRNYQVETTWIKDFKGDVSNFDFVILHQLPSKINPATTVLQALDNKKIPRLYIVGAQSDLVKINQLQNFVDLKSDGRNTNEVQASVSAAFNLFTIADAVRSDLPKFAPVTAPFGDFREMGNGQTLLYQRIGKVDTKYPLLTVGEYNGARVGVFLAEGLFKWRLFNFLQFQNHDIFNEVVAKTVQYLSLKEDKRKFRISLPKNIFNENEPVIFDAELYNENFELINDPDASLVIKNQDGKEFPYTFNKNGRTYNLKAGIFPVGDYTFKGAVNNGGQNLTFDGKFSVQPVQLESYATTADHGLLSALSKESGGEMLAAANISDFVKMLETKATIKPVIYSTVKNWSVINLKWIFYILAGLLVLEWFLRRYFGSY